MTRHERECAIYLAAMIDGEGYACATPGKNGTYKTTQVIITNTDPGILHGIRYRLQVLGIEYREQNIGGGRYSPGKEIQINRKESIARIGDTIVPFMCASNKKVTILEIRDYYRMRNAT